MRGLRLLFAVTSVAIFTLFGNTECLHCFTCSNITNDEDCQRVTQCADNEICFVERNSPGNTTKFTSGCINAQNCPSKRPFTIVGRSTQEHCVECCSTDGCNIDLCDIQQIQVGRGWSMWGNWSACSSTCGIATKTRTRVCSHTAVINGSTQCQGNQKQILACFDRPCPVHGAWSGWGTWEGCSSPCRIGINKRHRFCNNQSPTLYGSYCQGDPVDYTICTGHGCGNTTTTAPSTTTQASHCFDLSSDCSLLNKSISICTSPRNARLICPDFCRLCSKADGYWASWSSWEKCSTTCGNGTWTKTRTCINLAPSKGGKPCPGSSTDTGICNIRQCPVHGNWALWGKWSTCSASCGQGLTHRRRTCTNPRPSYNGNYCFCDPTEYAMCLVNQCPVPAIVFNVHQTTNLSLPVDQPVVFSSIISNIGNGYNSSTGKFTAPVNGTYSFTVQLCVAYQKAAYFSVVLDDSIVTHVQYYDRYATTTTSTTVPLFLTQGQKVWVQPTSSCSGCLKENSTCWNSFSGSLVHN